MSLKKLILSGIFTALTVLGAFIQIPLGDLPVTLQTFFVFMAGLMLEPRYAFLSQFAYMAAGLIGLPVFSKGGGFGYVLQPSFGFIVGFCVCAFLVSALARKNLLAFFYGGRKTKPLLKAAGGMLLSVAALYITGISYMYLIYNLYMAKQVSAGYLILNAAGIFFLIDTAKFVLAAPLCAAVLKRLPKGFIEPHLFERK